MSASDRIKHNVHAIPGEAVYLLHVVLMLVIDRDAAQVGNCLRGSC
jgi:hypothetical protein